MTEHIGLFFLPEGLEFSKKQTSCRVQSFLQLTLSIEEEENHSRGANQLFFSLGKIIFLLLGSSWAIFEYQTKLTSSY